MSRLPAVDPANLNAEQRKVYDSIASGPRGGVRGPFLALIHVPELTNRIQNLGEYLRYNTSYPPRLSEFAIIITARHFNSQYEWHAHAALALKGGLSQAIVDAVREKRRPQSMQPDETDVYDFVSELTTNNKVSEGTYKRVVDRFKIAGAVELAGLVGYYIMIAMTLLAHEVPLPEGQAPYWK